LAAELQDRLKRGEAAEGDLGGAHRVFHHAGERRGGFVAGAVIGSRSRNSIIFGFTIYPLLLAGAIVNLCRCMARGRCL